MSDLDEMEIIDRINRSYDDNTQYVEASAKDWNCIVHLIRKQQKEIEEKTTILLAGAEKVKQLEKEIEELKSIASEFTNRNIQQFSIGEFNFKVKHFKDNYIHKDKIKELKEKVEKEMISNPYDFSYMINEL